MTHKVVSLTAEPDQFLLCGEDKDTKCSPIQPAAHKLYASYTHPCSLYYTVLAPTTFHDETHVGMWDTSTQ